MIKLLLMQMYGSGLVKMPPNILTGHPGILGKTGMLKLQLFIHPGHFFCTLQGALQKNIDRSPVRKAVLISVTF